MNKQSISPFKILFILLWIPFVSTVITSKANASDKVISADLQDTQNAISTFQKNTKPILNESHKLNQQHIEQIQELGDKLEQTESALSAIKSTNIADLEENASRMLVLASRYLSYYKSFINSISHQSSCYQPQQIQQFQRTIDELKEYVDSISTLTSTQSEAEAFEALMNIVINQARVSMVVNQFELFQLCFINDAIGPLAQDLQRLHDLLGQHALVGKGDVLEPNMTQKSIESSENSPEKYRDNIVKTVELKADLTTSINDLTYLYLDNIAQLNDLSLSNGLSINQDLTLRLPAFALIDQSLPYEANIKGRIETDTDIVDIDITVTRLGTQSIHNIVFRDETLAKCVKDMAAMFQINYSNQLSQLNCTFSTRDMIKLDDLAPFNNLELLSFKGGTISTLAPLASLSSLNMLVLDTVNVKSLNGLNQYTGSLTTSKVISDDWLALANTRSSAISINDLAECSRLAKLTEHNNVAVIYKGQEPSELVKTMAQVDSGAKSVMVMTDCTSEQVGVN
ncbi:hypothetical protein TUM4438_37330 [Shewanella sairae]|uniref:Uncharacterized protein n=1 Tax=Shewanella sairae TaxID=190310 RepID=A0ABQ4PPG9_9GAMM|nr:hypothetical protein [Shewanella sairae]MCL1130379.1 hypothetical protein [Shewanella sairae]GIU50628.1 hypothetical protein TUM4438_37330 [Shewanella sairae]